MDTKRHEWLEGRNEDASEQLELDFSEPQPFPPILTLREFVAQMERDYGSSVCLDALRAAMEEPS